MLNENNAHAFYTELVKLTKQSDLPDEAKAKVNQIVREYLINECYSVKAINWTSTIMDKILEEK